MSLVSDLRQLVEPYTHRGDVLADDLHRLLAIIEGDHQAAAEGADTVPSTGEPMPESGHVEPAPDQQGQAVQPVPPAEAQETAHQDPQVQDIAGGGSGGTVPVEPATDQGQGA